MKLEASVALADHEARGFEHLDVLRHRLPRGGDAVLHREARAELEERLAVTVDQFVQYRAPGRVGYRSVDFIHGSCKR